MLRSASVAAITRRRFVVAASAMAGAALWGRLPALARQATPIAEMRDWQGETWIGTWATSPHMPGPGFEDVMPSQIFEFDDQTVRQIVRVSAGGYAVRIRLSNLFGEEPLLIGAARVALREDGETIDPASDHVLTFSGQPSISIPPGALALSDPVDLAVPPLAELAVSLYFPEAVTSNTVHGFSFQTNYLAPAGGGDQTAEATLPADATMQTWVFLTGVDVAVSEPANVVIALGDSITDGAFSTPDTNQRWPDLLANRLVESADEGQVSVLNQGIGGNRLLSSGEGDFAFTGPAALARFDRDVLAQPGATHLIVYLGINDIGFATMAGEEARAEELIAALRQIAERGHEAGLIVLGATITPFAGAAYYSPEGEVTRQAVNEWIRTGGAYDAVIDFDAVVRDPANPAHVLPAFDGGDALHINDAGFAAMADSIDLSLLRG